MGGTVKGTSFCINMNNSGQIQTNLQKMPQQVQVFHNLTQVLDQIPTLILSMGFDLFSWLDPQKWKVMVTDRISNYHLFIGIVESGIFALLRCFMCWVTKTLPAAFNISTIYTVPMIFPKD